MVRPLAVSGVGIVLLGVALILAQLTDPLDPNIGAGLLWLLGLVVLACGLMWVFGLALARVLKAVHRK